MKPKLVGTLEQIAYERDLKRARHQDDEHVESGPEVDALEYELDHEHVVHGMVGERVLQVVDVADEVVQLIE